MHSENDDDFEVIEVFSSSSAPLPPPARLADPLVLAAPPLKRSRTAPSPEFGDVLDFLADGHAVKRSRVRKSPSPTLSLLSLSPPLSPVPFLNTSSRNAVAASKHSITANATTSEQPRTIDRSSYAHAGPSAQGSRSAAAAAKAALASETKAAKARFAAANKLRSNREEPLREIRVIVSADLADASSPFSKALPALTEKLNSCASSITVSTAEANAVDACQGVFQIERFVSATYDPVAKVFQPLPPGDGYWRREDTVVLFKTAVEVVGCMVDNAAAAAGASGSSSPSTETLSSRIASVKRRLDKQTNGRQLQVVLVIHGLKKYISRKKLDKEMIDREILRVGLMERCFVLHVDTPENTFEQVWNLLADVAIRPYKSIQRSHLPFSTAVSRKGRSPSDTFQLMLSQIPRITESGACEVVKRYPTFKRMMEAWEAAEAGGDAKTAEEMLRDCPVPNLVTGVQSHGVLGKARSTRIHTVMRNDNADHVVT